jgi:hypothetical protein
MCNPSTKVPGSQVVETKVAKMCCEEAVLGQVGFVGRIGTGEPFITLV